MLIRFLAKLFYVVLICVESMVTLRFLFLLIGANAQNVIVSTIYDISEIFVGPFHGIVSSPWTVGRFSIDIDALITLAMCMLLGYVTFEIIRIFSPRDTK